MLVALLVESVVILGVNEGGRLWRSLFHVNLRYLLEPLSSLFKLVLTRVEHVGHRVEVLVLYDRCQQVVLPPVHCDRLIVFETILSRMHDPLLFDHFLVRVVSL
jgi:hypothetical protein